MMNKVMTIYRLFKGKNSYKVKGAISTLLNYYKKYSKKYKKIKKGIGLIKSSKVEKNGKQKII